jgi:signal transduction histidine kinase/CheY-like chemotaxis protein
MTHRHRLIRPLILFWLVITLASLALGTLAWTRLAAGGGAPIGVGTAIQSSVQWIYRLTLVAGLLGVGAGLCAVYLYQADDRRDQARGDLLLEKLQAEQSVKDKGAFLMNMSHEIRSPMNAILGFSELLEPEGLTPKQSEYVRAIRDSGASLLQTINDILDLSKIEAGRLELHPDPTDMRDSCEFLRTVFAQEAVNKSLKLQFDLAPDLPRALLLDRLRLRQVLVNLLSNAIKFTERGSVKTTVSWHKVPSSSTGTLSVDVEDTGIGIPPDQLEEIFKPFVQARNRTAVDNQGTGIGLTIVKRLTEMMKGTLMVESKPGKGSAFRLRLNEVPVSVRLPLSDHAEPGGSTDFNDFAPATLLVVDDNPVNRELMISMFEKTHHRVHTARNGREAIDWLAKFEADVVLLDLRMPVLDGRAALAEIRRHPEWVSLPVIAVTASSPVGDEASLRSYFSGFIRKPFSRHTLFQELALYLQRMPRQNVGGDRRVAPASEGPDLSRIPERLDHWRALVLDLRSLESGEWRTLSDSMAINDTRAFGEKLRKLGNAAHCSPLTIYADAMLVSAAAYAIGDLEEALASFPALINSIEAASDQPRHPG